MIEGTHPDNDREAWIDKQINKMADRYVACDARSSELNKERAEIRNDAEKLGIKSRAFMDAVSKLKNMSPGERRDYEAGYKRVTSALEGRQKELFPEQYEKAIKRDEERASTAQERSPDELDLKTDTDKRSDPNAGGAKPSVQEVTDAEQAEGEGVLAGKSAAWRDGFNAHAAGSALSDNAYIEGSAEARDWVSGFNAANDRSFNEAEPPAPGDDDDGPEAPPLPPVEDGQTYTSVAQSKGDKKPAAPAKKKPISQSAKANAKKAEAGVA